MPRSNRPRRRSTKRTQRASMSKPRAFEDEMSGDISNILRRGPRIEVKADGDWFVRPIPSGNALKPYVCPGCSNVINPGVAHLVVWRNDWLMGEAAALDNRRHWHEGCWRARSYSRR